jgi:hypothetical protein
MEPFFFLRIRTSEPQLPPAALQLHVPPPRATAHVCLEVGSCPLTVSYEEEDTCMSYEEEDTCMSYEEEDTCPLTGLALHAWAQEVVGH